MTQKRGFTMSGQGGMSQAVTLHGLAKFSFEQRMRP
jgi:hypothetical protein